MRKRKVVVVVRPGKRAGTVLAWLRQLLPAAVLLIAPATLPPTFPDGAEDIIVDAEDVDSPMSLADAIAKGQARVQRD
jgi:hypothetical protein